MPGAPGVANELPPSGFEAKDPPKGLLDAPPKALPPPKLDLAPPNAPNPLPDEGAVDKDVVVGEANEESLGAPPNGDAALAAAPKFPNGDVVELAKLPKPEALNLSSEV
jgi:hypothetical protein